MATSTGFEIGDPTKLRIKPTYNVGDYGHDVSLPLLLAQSTNLATLIDPKLHDSLDSNGCSPQGFVAIIFPY